MLSLMTILAAGGEPGRSPPERSMPQAPIAEVLADQTDRLMSIPGVIGVALGRCEGRPCIKVLVEKETAEVLRALPSTLQSYPVSIEDVGELRARDRTSPVADMAAFFARALG